MAEAERRLTLGADAQFAPWSTAYELATITEPESWVLVGGLMVEAHVRAAGVDRNRATSDVDIIVDVAGRQASIQQLYGELLQAGFFLEPPARRGAPPHRMTRNGDIVDLMVARNASPLQRLAGSPALAVEGAAHAVLHSERWSLIAEQGVVTIRIPRLFAAIIAKCVAYMVDQRDPGRHLEDLAALLAAAGPNDIDDFSAVSGKERKRMRSAFAALAPTTATAWLDIEGEHATRAQLVRGLVVSVAQL